MQFEQEGIRLFDTLQIRYYGLIIVFAMLVAAWIAARLAKRDGRDPEHIWGGLTWAIIPGIILARLWFVLFPPVSLTAGCATPNPSDVCRDLSWFLQNFFDPQNGAIAIWSGGLSIFGAVIGGLIGTYLYMSPWHNKIVNFFSRLWWVFIGLIGIIAIILGATNSTLWAIVVGVILVVLVVLWFIPRTRGLIARLAGSSTTTFPDSGLPFGPWLDIAAVALPLGQAIGRWANWVNQELYGSITSLPWGITIDSSHRIAPYGSTVDFPVASTLFHPLFLYESLWSLIAFFVLLNVYQRNRHRLLPGDIFLFYIMQYAVIRFLLEFLRVDFTQLPGTALNLSQIVTALAFVVALVYFLYRHRSGAVTVPPSMEPKTAENTQ